MRAIIFQQGSGSRITALHLWNEIPTTFDKPLPNEEKSLYIIKTTDHARIAYNHLEQMPWLYDMLKNHKIIHLYRDPARTFIRKMTKYDLTVNKDDLKEHVEYVEKMRKKVNDNFRYVEIMHYEDIKKEYRGEIKELNHL